MLLWENSFEYEVRRLNQQPNFPSSYNYVRNKTFAFPASPEISRTAPLRNYKPLKIQLIGTQYGHCAVILALVAPGSTIISAGVGEDTSFDTELIRLKNCQIIGVDPTDKARRYIENNKNPNFHFLQKALYTESGKKIKIYKNTNPDYVSESITPSHNMVSPSEFYEAETISIPDLLRQYRNVSVLKMDIEGAEYDIINSLGKLDIPQIYVEFHHFCTDFTAYDTEKCIEHLDSLGYVVTYCKSQAGVPKDMSFVHRKYINQSDIVKMSVKQLETLKCQNTQMAVAGYD
jgi:FkbM family methyltransferase